MATLTTVALHLRGTHWETPSLAQSRLGRTPLRPRTPGDGLRGPAPLERGRCQRSTGPRPLSRRHGPPGDAGRVHPHLRAVYPPPPLTPRAPPDCRSSTWSHTTSPASTTRTATCSMKTSYRALRARKTALCGPANPGWQRERAERAHGRGYQEWDGWGRMRIAASCEPEADDQVIVTGRQLDRICRRQGIKNLVYTGFATNMCIMHSAAATAEMLGYGYKIFLIREATLAVEYPETWKARAGDADGLEGVPAQDRRYRRLRAIYGCVCRRRRSAAAHGLGAAGPTPRQPSTRPSPGGEGESVSAGGSNDRS